MLDLRKALNFQPDLICAVGNTEMSDVRLCQETMDAYAARRIDGALPVESVEQAEAAARVLQRHGARAVVITMGAAGSLLLAGDQTQFIKPFTIAAVDTTAAGDAFAGALAVHWAKHDDLAQAACFANAAGALAASREGAQSSMATSGEIEILLGNRK